MKGFRYFVLCVFLAAGCTYVDRAVDGFSTIRGSWGYKNSAAGASVLTFNKDMTYDLDINGDGAANISGVYSVSGNILRLTDTDGEFDRKKCSQTGIYTFEIASREIQYQLVADQCSYRSQALGLTWQRVKKRK